jgi:DNA-binding beta-propeller fold protein YncE
VNRRTLLLSLAGLPALAAAEAKERRLLYVGSPGIRNYVEYGGVGVLVFDIDQGHRFVKRIPTFGETPGVEAENVKGICASARTGRLYVSTIKRLLCLDLATDKPLWNREYEGGCDRKAISPNGKVIYLPSLEQGFWNVIDAATGDPITRITTNSGSHNTVYGPDGLRVYLGGLKSPYLFVADTRSHTAEPKVGPFGGVIRPFTVNGAQRLAYVCVNDLLGFEIGDLKSGKLLHRVEIPGVKPGPVKRHGCPSHGVGLTPDEREVWVCDGFNERVHVFDNRTLPLRYVTSMKLREQPGWVTFSIDGQYAYPSTGEVFDTKSKQLVVALADEQGRPVHSEKLLEIDFRDGKPVRSGDQFGIGHQR